MSIPPIISIWLVQLPQLNATLHQGGIMKQLIISALLGVFLASPAFADWIEDFTINFEAQGIEVAVPKALEEGKNPDDIVEEGLKLTDLNPQNLLKALYCSGADGDDIKQAADKNDISEIIVVAAFKKSVVECGDRVADSQAYTPIARFAGMPSPGGGGGNTYASPNNFQQ